MNHEKNNGDSPQPRGDDVTELSRAKLRLIQGRAARLGITPAEAESLLDAERRSWRAASPEDDDAELNQALAELEESEYPNAECLDPHEVEEAVTGQLAPERREHAEQCPFCRTLLDMALPKKERADAFLEEVRETCSAAGLARADLASAHADLDVDSWAETRETTRRPVSVAARLVRSGSEVLAGAVMTIVIGVFAIRSGWIAPSLLLRAGPAGDSVTSEIDDLGARLVSQPNDPSQEMRTITLSPDRKRMAVLKGDGAVIVWDPAEKKRIREFSGDEGASIFAHFSEEAGWPVVSGGNERHALEAGAHREEKAEAKAED